MNMKQQDDMLAARKKWWAELSDRGDPQRLTNRWDAFADGFEAGRQEQKIGWWPIADEAHLKYGQLAQTNAVLADLIRNLPCPFPFSDNKDGEIGYCQEHNQCGCVVKTKLDSAMKGQAVPTVKDE